MHKERTGIMYDNIPYFINFPSLRHSGCQINKHLQEFAGRLGIMVGPYLDLVQDRSSFEKFTVEKLIVHPAYQVISKKDL